MITHKSAFELIESDPKRVELLTEKSRLMNSIVDLIHEKRITQKRASEIIGCDQPRISRLKGGRISEFSLDWLFDANSKLSK